MLIASAVHFAVIPAWGALSDRLGRRPVYLFGAVGMALWVFPFFQLLDTRSFGSIVLAVTVGLVLHGAMYAPQAAFFSELFATRMRYSGASIGAQFSSVAAGAPAPLIATALLADYGNSTPIALYVIAAALLTVIAIACAKETRSRDLSEITKDADGPSLGKPRLTRRPLPRGGEAVARAGSPAHVPVTASRRPAAWPLSPGAGRRC